MKIFYLFFITYLIFGQYGILLSQSKSELPTIEKDVYPFEGCQLGEWISRDTIKVYKKEENTTSIKYLLSENDTITALYGNIHYERSGTVLAAQSFNNFIVI